MIVLVGFPAGAMYGIVSGNSPRAAEGQEIVRQAAPVCCTVIGVVCGVLQARRKLRKEMSGS